MKLVHLLLVASALAVGCGGKTANGGPGDGGGSGNGSGASGGGDGSGNGSGGSGASSGGSGGEADSGPPDGPSVTDATLSGDGSSSGGGDGSMGDESNVCKPLPGCTSSTQCPATDGCNACTCEDGVWECTGYACPDGGNVACGTGPGPYVNGRPCTPPPQACSWPLGPGYECSFYFCSCSFGGEWFCSQEDCDGGAGLNVGEGGAHGTYPCPVEQPSQSSSCPLDGALCSYGYGTCGNVFSTNCLCFEGVWDCATAPGCDE
jgi:hypothetical protein